MSGLKLNATKRSLETLNLTKNQERSVGGVAEDYFSAAKQFSGLFGKIAFLIKSIVSENSIKSREINNSKMANKVANILNEAIVNKLFEDIDSSNDSIGSVIDRNGQTCELYLEKTPSSINIIAKSLNGEEVETLYSISKTDLPKIQVALSSVIDSVSQNKTEVLKRLNQLNQKIATNINLRFKNNTNDYNAIKSNMISLYRKKYKVFFNKPENQIFSNYQEYIAIITGELESYSTVLNKTTDINFNISGIELGNNKFTMGLSGINYDEQNKQNDVAYSPDIKFIPKWSIDQEETDSPVEDIEYEYEDLSAENNQDKIKSIFSDMISSTANLQLIKNFILCISPKNVYYSDENPNLSKSNEIQEFIKQKYGEDNLPESVLKLKQRLSELNADTLYSQSDDRSYSPKDEALEVLEDYHFSSLSTKEQSQMQSLVRQLNIMSEFKSNEIEAAIKQYSTEQLYQLAELFSGGSTDYLKWDQDTLSFFIANAITKVNKKRFSNYISRI